MSESAAFVGFGALLQVADDASPLDFTTIAEVNSIKPGRMVTQAVQVTHHESPDNHHEKRPGMKDTQPFVVQGNYLPLNATQGTSGKGLAKLWKDRTIASFRVKVPDGTGSTYLGPFDAFVTGLEIGEMSSATDKVPFTAEFTPTTQVALP